ncbi:hypothetical protein SAMN05192563_1004315 [Paraburkholderia aspalathi]|uniref:Uncharacterized protein n=1 Tax=Paraburkholderia aspalathi TaxID=1324617 RepID=A0A1I7BAA1_9BURK|nr:hypothetical protein SAMN05192563_1004315 [Paraburkholderia aspalathi]
MGDMPVDRLQLVQHARSKTHQIKLVDKYVNHTYRVISVDVIVERLRQQRDLLSRRAFDVSLHGPPSENVLTNYRRSTCFHTASVGCGQPHCSMQGTPRALGTRNGDSSFMQSVIRSTLCFGNPHATDKVMAFLETF